MKRDFLDAREDLALSPRPARHGALKGSKRNDAKARMLSMT